MQIILAFFAYNIEYLFIFHECERREHSRQSLENGSTMDRQRLDYGSTGFTKQYFDAISTKMYILTIFCSNNLHICKKSCIFA